MTNSPTANIEVSDLVHYVYETKVKEELAAFIEKQKKKDYDDMETFKADMISKLDQYLDYTVECFLEDYSTEIELIVKDLENKKSKEVTVKKVRVKKAK